MDKSEYNLKIEELKAAMHAHDFEKAVDVADSLDIKKIRDNNLLSLIADAYELTGDNEQAKKILLMAYENTNTGRQLAYRLCLISIKLKELDDGDFGGFDFSSIFGGAARQQAQRPAKGGVQTYCIVQALLIDNILKFDLLTSLSSHQHAVVLRYNVMPRTRPSVELMATQRTTSSPRCCMTSATRSIA